MNNINDPVSPVEDVNLDNQKNDVEAKKADSQSTQETIDFPNALSEFLSCFDGSDWV